MSAIESKECCWTCISRFGSVVIFMRENLVPAVVASLIFEFAFVSATLSLGGIALVRLLCQINISVMEEQIGEKAIRVTHAFTTLAMAIISCIALLASGDILTGTAYNLLTAGTNTIG